MIEGYPYIKLSEICSVNQGLQIAISKRYKTTGPDRYFYITVQFLKESEVEKFYVENPPKSTICREDDIIIVRTGSTGQVLTGIVGCFHNNFFKVNYMKDKVFGRYLYYCLTSKEKQREMKIRAGITTIPDLNHFMFLDMKIPLPDLRTQEQIARVLDLFNSKISLNNRINKKLEVMAKLIYDYWFVQFDFPMSKEQAEAIGKPAAAGKPYKSSGSKMVYNEQLKREIPEGWEVDNLSSWIKHDKSGDWGKESLEGNYTEKVSCIRGADINGLNGKGVVKSPTRYILEKNSHKMLDAGDLIIEISGGSPTQSTGRLAFITEATLSRFDTPIICSNFCKAVTLNNINTIFNFVFEWNRLYDAGVLFGWEGKTSGIKNFLFDSFVTKHFTQKPPTELMKEFFDKMSPIQKKIQTNLKENQKLSELRDWLLPMLMNGQVTIKDATKYSEEALNGDLPMAAEERGEYGENKL